jgi:hydrogenase 3 maturation protease
VTKSIKNQVENLINPILSAKGRSVILGVGSSLNCDDGAGPAVASALISGMKRRKFPENIMVLNGCAAPENFTGEIKRFGPDTLIIIDAADFSAAPGCVKLIDLKDITGATFSSHMLPVRIMAEYLEKETGCKTFLIGIQPESVLYGDVLSKPVADTVKEIIRIALANIRAHLT